MKAGITERPTRPLTEVERIFQEAPHGERWAERLTAALRAEYGVDPEWDGPYPGECSRDGTDAYFGRWLWWVKRS
jgi:hypothetical protein